MEFSVVSEGSLPKSMLDEKDGENYCQQCSMVASLYDLFVSVHC